VKLEIARVERCVFAGCDLALNERTLNVPRDGTVFGLVEWHFIHTESQLPVRRRDHPNPEL
jgi:hypothetical protein